MPSSNASHGLRSRQPPSRAADAAALDPERRDPAREAVQAARRQQGVEEREPQRRLDRAPPEVAFDALEDRLEADQLAGRVQVEQAVDQGLGALDDREAVPEPARATSAPSGSSARRTSVVVERGGPLLGAAALAAADRAAVVLADGPRAGVGRAVGRRARPAR